MRPLLIVVTSVVALGRPAHALTANTLPASTYEALIDWLQSTGAEISDKLVVRPSANGVGYGAFVTDAVDQGELLFTVPRPACVTLEDALQDADCGPIWQRLIDKAGPGGNTVAMAGFLAKERLQMMQDIAQGRPVTSRFGPYLATLPWERGINRQEHVLYWSDNEIYEYLPGSMCYEEAVALRDEVALATKVVQSIVAPSVRQFRGQEVDAGFKWPWQVTLPTSEPPAMLEGLSEAVTGAFVTLLTRSFQDGDDDEEKLVPMLDMLQHSDTPNVSHVMRKDDKMVQVRARRPIAADEELLNQYRSELEESMPYHRFFTRFGFVPGIQEDMRELLSDKSSIFFAQKAEV